MAVSLDQKSPFGESKSPFNKKTESPFRKPANPFDGQQRGLDASARSADSAPMRRESSPATVMPGQVNKKAPGYGLNTDLEKEKVEEARQNVLAQQQIDPMQQFQQFLASIDPGEYDYEGAVREAFAKSYAALDNAANTARTNKAQSATAVQGLAQSGSNLIKKDASVLSQITGDATNAVDGIYTGQVRDLQDDRSKEVADRAAFVKALGIQEAGLGTAGSTQTEAITEATGANTRDQTRLQGYGQADQVRNTELAQAMLNEGTLRQADLESQLTAILGGIDTQRAEVGGQEAQALAQAKQQSYENAMAKFAAGQKAYGDEIDRGYKDQDQQMKLLELQMKYGGADGQGGQSLSPTGNQAADAYVQGQGQDVGTYRNFMSKFMMDLQNDPNVKMNNASDNYILSKMMQQSQADGLDPNVIANMYQLQQDAPIKYMD